MSSPTTDAPPARTNSWRASHSIRERMLRVAGLRQRGLGPANIAAQLGVSPSTVSRDLHRLDILWRQEYTHLANAERLRSLATLRESERLCWSLINRHQDDDDHLAGVTAAARTLLAVQREIRQLLGHLPIPHSEHFWGYRHEGPTLLQRLKDTLEPKPSRILYPGDLDRDYAAHLEAERRGDDETLSDPIHPKLERLLRHAGPFPEPE